MFDSSHSTIRRIRRLVKRLQGADESELRRQSLTLKYKASTGHRLSELIPQAFALVTEAARRTLNMTPYDVQLFGAIQIASGHVAEMKTGEGKTLTATLPVYLRALQGRGAHVATVNDYLAQRDFELMGPVYQLLGLSIGVVQSESSPSQRQAAYRQDITYGTAKEFGFDFLRDRLAKMQRDSGRVTLCQRELNYCLVDEADSVLIDEARTPLIIGVVDSVEARIQQECFRWAAQYADQFTETNDFRYDHERRKLELLKDGERRIRRLPQNAFTRLVSLRKLNKYIADALKVRRDFQLHKNYVVRDGQIAIVDEFTGRVAEGRQWQDGIHQSVEAKEKIEITPATRQGATVTLQSFFKRYRDFSGMTGTAWTSRREFQKVYQKKVVRIPTNRPIDRDHLPTVVFRNFESKMDAVAVEIETMIQQSRAVLVGTRSIEKSERLSNLLTQRQIRHEVLNANNLAREAEIVANCGRPGCVTVATNMAGRGTDILLSEEVRQAGGLHVMLTELHESQRIDWQLIGRGSRQGNPGSFRIFVALDDELIELGLGPEKAARLVSKYGGSTAEPAVAKPLPREAFQYFRAAQQKLERKYLTDRMVLRRQDKEKHERQFEMGLDPYCEVVR